MENIRWDQVKNEKIKAERDISFEEIMACIEKQQVLAVIQNPSKNHSGQMMFVIELKDYIYYVPFVRDESGIFLKTIIPSRKLAKEYLK